MFVGKMSLKAATVVRPSDDVVEADHLYRILMEGDAGAGTGKRKRPAKADPFPKVEDIVDQLSDRIGHRDDQPTAIS